MIPTAYRVSLDDLAADVETLRLARAEEAKWKAVKEAAAEKIRERMGVAEEGTIDGHVIVTWRTHEHTDLDVKRLRNEITDDVLRPYLRTSTRRTFIVGE
jgi:hypothetical protein